MVPGNIRVKPLQTHCSIFIIYWIPGFMNDFLPSRLTLIPTFLSIFITLYKILVIEFTDSRAENTCQEHTPRTPNGSLILGCHFFHWALPSVSRRVNNNSVWSAFFLQIHALALEAFFRRKGSLKRAPWEIGYKNLHKRSCRTNVYANLVFSTKPLILSQLCG